MCKWKADERVDGFTLRLRASKRRGEQVEGARVNEEGAHVLRGDRGVEGAPRVVGAAQRA